MMLTRESWNKIKVKLNEAMKEQIEDEFRESMEY